MTTTMRAIVSGNLGDGATKVRRGQEFTVEKDARAKELEYKGLAVPVGNKSLRESPSNKMEVAAPQNKAAVSGPLEEAGGATVVAGTSSLSPQDSQPPRGFRSSSQKKPSDDE